MDTDQTDNVHMMLHAVELTTTIEATQSYPAVQPADAETTEAAATEMTDMPYKVARAQIIRAFEKEYVTKILRRYNHNVSRAAREAGIDRVYLHRLIKKYGLR